MSNDDWKNPHDPDAKIGPTKAGAIDMIYKPEHTVDLETGAIVQAEVRLGHEGDDKDLAAHVLQAQENINQAQDRSADSLTILSTTADKAANLGPLSPLRSNSSSKLSRRAAGVCTRPL